MLLWLLIAGLRPAFAATYPLPPDGDALIGKVQEVRVQKGETLLDIARRHSVGLDELQHANPGVDPWLPPPGQRVLVPSQYLLPNAPREGIVVNLPELRLYYYPPAAPGAPRVVMTYPLGIGSEGRAIPLASTKIVQKRVDPPWVVPESIRAEHAAEGEFLPKVVPPGPDNPLGRYAMRLGLTSYLIHSTNRPYSVGMRVSHGCLRMYPEHIEALFPRVALGTPVHIIDQPYKVGWHAGVLYLESHPPMAEAGHTPESNLTPMVAAITTVVSRRLDERAWQLASDVATRSAGIPTAIFTPTAAAVAPSDAAASAPVAAAPAGVAPAAAAAAAAESSPSVPADSRWLVQVGVFRNPENARQVAELIRRMALPLLASARSDASPCRVLVGPYATVHEAVLTSEKIYRSAGLKNMLVSAERDGAPPVCAAN